jgi:hypothetical protein
LKRFIEKAKPGETVRNERISITDENFIQSVVLIKGRKIESTRKISIKIRLKKWNSLSDIIYILQKLKTTNLKKYSF